MWPYSEAALQGWLRAQIAIYIAGWFLLLAPVGILIRYAAPSVRSLVASVAIAAIVGLLMMVAISASIVLFNAPKWLVVPALRDQEGLVSEWRKSRRGK